MSGLDVAATMMANLSARPRGGLRASVSGLALVAAAIGMPAAAQEVADEIESEEILVTGYKQSLESAQARKQNSDLIVDSVTAEDIGALPDRSVTETLQRIPGISINRFAAGLDPDHFSVEGSGVVVRGLTYVRSEFNGREAFTANNGRALGFADVPSELLGGVDVIKSPSADRIEGGIAGIVNLRTRLPFDKTGLVAAGSLELNYSDFIKKESPTGAVVLSNTWDTGAGQFGLLASFSYSQLFSRADRFQVSSFRLRPIFTNGARTDVVPFTGATQTGQGLFPRGAVLGRQDFDRERYGYAAAAQWRSNDGDMEATFQFLRSDARQAWTEFTSEIATDNVASNGDSRAVFGTSIEFDDTGLFDSGFITGPTGWRDDRQVDGSLRTPILGLQSNNIRRDNKNRSVTSDYAFNFRWDVSDRFALNFDYQHVDSFVKVRDNTLWTSSYQDAFIDLNGSKLPTVLFQPPQNCTVIPCPGTPGSAGGTVFFNDDDEYPAYFTGTHQSYSDPFNSFYRAAMDHFEDSDGNSDAFRVDGELSFPDDGFLKSLRIGMRYADRDQTARFSIYNWGVLSEQWGNRGPVWLDEPVDGIQGGTGGSPPQGYQEVCFNKFFRGAVANPLNGSCRLFYSGNTVTDYDAYAAYAEQIVREWQGTPGTGGGGGWTPLASRAGVVSGTAYLPGEINSVGETNHAAYLMARFGHEFSGGAKLSGNVGVRWSFTERVAPGFLQIADNPGSITSEAACAAIPPGSSPPPFCTFTPAVRQQARNFLNGALVANDARLTYEYFLPSFNARLEVGNGLQFRAAYFKGVAPPEFGYTRNYFNITGLDAVENRDASGNVIPDSYTIQATFNAGNPQLKPTTSDNFDFTAEWYFSNVGQLTASLFHKRLHGVLTNDIRRVDITNNGATFPAVITTPVNSDKTGKITGFELAYQQVFDFLPGFLKGLGLQANYTYVDSSGVPQSTLSATDPDVAAGRQPTIAGDQFPLQGLSKHQFNITPFIDIGPVSARASYNWRSRYMLTLRDVITPFDPIFQEKYGQLDASITWSVTDQIKVGVQGVNLLDSITRTTAAVLDQNGEVRFVPRGWYTNDRRYTAVLRFNF
jgi:TonB-dependent receptor